MPFMSPELNKCTYYNHASLPLVPQQGFLLHAAANWGSLSNGCSCCPHSSTHMDNSGQTPSGNTVLSASIMRSFCCLLSFRQPSVRSVVSCYCRSFKWCVDRIKGTVGSSDGSTSWWNDVKSAAFSLSHSHRWSPAKRKREHRSRGKAAKKRLVLCYRVG